MVKILSIIVGIIVVAGAIFLVMNKSKTPSSGERPPSSLTFSTSSDDTVKTTSTSNPSSPQEAMRKGGQYKCTYEASDPNATTKGTMYIDGNNVRADFEAYAAATGKTFVTHTVIDTEFVYTWTEPATFGMKLPVVPATAEGGGTLGSMNFSSGSETSNYSCEPWTKDHAKFVIPANLKFMEAPAAQ